MRELYNIDEYIEDYREDLIHFANRDANLLKEIINSCESPLEQQLLIWISKFFVAKPVKFGEDLYLRGMVVDLSDYKYPISIRHQRRICIGEKQYRADFLVSVYEHDESRYGNLYSPFLKIVVEVDGHDYHEKTKEQAEYDKKRDRALKTKGYQVLRFTGREVYRDAEDCAHEVLNYICEHIKRLTSVKI